jgi:hypothetical protein
MGATVREPWMSANEGKADPSRRGGLGMTFLGFAGARKRGEGKCGPD